MSGHHSGDIAGNKGEKQFKYVKSLLLATEIIETDYVTAVLGAVDIYRTLRKKGITILKSNDCLIAWYAIHHRMVLIHNDQDFELIAGHTALKTFSEAG